MLLGELDSGKNIRLFKNPLLERFTYVHPLLPLTIWGPLIIFWFTTGLWTQEISIGLSCQLALVGVLVWTASEYLLHRFVFHFVPKNTTQERLAFLLHGVHHEDPEDARR